MFSEIGDGGLPVAERGWDVGEQVLERGNQIGGFGDVDIQHLRAVLIQDNTFGCLEENIVEWVTCLAFFLYRSGKVVVYILRFPIGERESDFVDDCAINNDAISF